MSKDLKELYNRIEQLEKEIINLKYQLDQKINPPAQIHHHYHYPPSPEKQEVYKPYITWVGDPVYISPSTSPYPYTVTTSNYPTCIAPITYTTNKIPPPEGPDPLGSPAKV